MPSEPLQVSPLDLHNAGEQMLQAMTESVAAQGEHHSTMESAAPGLPTEAAEALQLLIASWTEQREALHRSVGGQGVNMQEAAAGYARADLDQAATLNQKAMDLGL